MVKVTRGHDQELGETGAGITSEDQINLDWPSELTNKWRKYLNPWIDRFTHRHLHSTNQGGMPLVL